jgi:arabinose-5-phosphate isomerase
MPALLDVPRAPAMEENQGLLFAQSVIRSEADTLFMVADRLDGAIARAAHWIHRGNGLVHVTGMGKAGLIGQKIAATFASTGTRASSMHPADAVHGDLGRIREGDVVLALSQSGETEEMVRLVPAVRRLGAGVIAVTGRTTSSLGRMSDLCVALGPIVEACPFNLAPTASSTAMLAVGDSLALLVSRLRGFTTEDFHTFHPGGTIGRRLGHVEDVMRTGRHVRTAHPDETIRAVLVRHGGTRRRSGAVLVIDPASQLLGIFTDSDLARLFESRRESSLDRPISESMTPEPQKVLLGTPLDQAIEALRARKLSELPVVDVEGKLVGLIDITDLIGIEADED